MTQIEQRALSLLLDCTTRWNTLASMLERFLRLVAPIKNALEDLNMYCLLKNGDGTNAKNMIDVLKPARIAIETLSRNENYLLRADRVINFFFPTLQKKQYILASELLKEYLFFFTCNLFR